MAGLTLPDWDGFLRRLQADGIPPQLVEPAIAEEDLESRLSLFHEEERSCKGCDLWQSPVCHRKVVGTGNPYARMYFIGEGPGEDEDRTGVPFTGITGTLLTLEIQSLGLRRADVYLSNAIRCRPEKNATPSDRMIEACRRFVRQEIDLIRPRVIVCLGKVGTKAVLGDVKSISEIRGQWQLYGSIPVMPTWHPSYVIRKLRGPEERQVKNEFWHDLRAAYLRAYGHAEKQAS